MGTSTLEPHLVETLQQAAWEVFETMVFMTPASGEALADSTKRFRGEVAGLLGFTGTRSGSFVVLTSRTLATTMAAKMLMMEPEEMTHFDEVADAFGEVVNMISGSFKNAWVAAGNLMELKQLRAGLRERILSSPLCDTPAFACSIETAYRDMWRKWCAQPKNIPYVK